jgi:crotonobetainyl-CoA:carnitine CoA-transferase CaiB-like acyl-CoA transferase
MARQTGGAPIKVAGRCRPGGRSTASGGSIPGGVEAGGMPADRLPLADVTVVDLTQVVAGPFATMNLADLGAEVVKVEAVGRGDRSRQIEPIPEYYDAVNRNKRSIAVDLKTDDGREVLRDVVADADVFIESMKPGRPEAFGLAYDDLVEVAPDLIYCSISGFGRDSPYEDLPAWDLLIQAMSGIMSVTGVEDGPPLWSGFPSGDLMAAMFASQSTLAALYARERGLIDTEWIEVPMLDAAIAALSARAGHTFGTGEPFPRLGVRHPTISPFGVFECADEAIVVAAGTDSLWAEFCAVIDREDLTDDERFATMEARVENVATLREVIEAELASADAKTWVQRLQTSAVPAGPINDTKSVWEDPHVERHGLRRSLARADGADAQVIDHPVHFSELASELHSPPETLGASTADVLAEHGYSAERIAELRESGVVQ